MTLTSEQLRAWFAAGPVLLLCDGDHAEHRGLPARARGQVVVAQLAGQEDLNQLLANSEWLTVPYGTDSGDAVATLDRSGVFALAGRTGDGTQVVLRQDAPALLGNEPPLALRQVLESLGMTARAPVWEQWPQVLFDSEATRTQAKREALESLLGSRRPVWLGLRSDEPGLKLAAAQADQHDLLLIPDTPDLQIDSNGVAWTQHVGPEVAYPRVPWSAIWAMQDGGTRQGWWWPGDVPRSRVEAWQQSCRRSWRWSHLGRGSQNSAVALAASPAPPLVLALAPPLGLTPRQAVERMIRHGLGVILVDALAPTVQVPSGLHTQPVVAVPVAMPGIACRVEPDDEGLTAQIPSPGETLADLRAPWSAVVSVSSMGGAIHGTWNWPDHPSPGLRHAMQRDPDGDAVLQLDQPLGAAEPWGVPTLHVEYRLARRLLN